MSVSIHTERLQLQLRPSVISNGEIYSSFLLTQIVDNVGIFALLKFENKMGREISHFDYDLLSN